MIASKRYFLLFLILLCYGMIKAQSLYDKDTLRSLYITFDNPNWHETLVANWFAQNGLRENADLEMDGILYEDVAIRYKGNATFYIANSSDNRKLPLNIDMNDNNEDQDLLGFNKVKLANAIFDPSMLRDVLGFSIYDDYMPAPEANWLNVYIDEEYIGLYPNTESINKQFLNKHFDYKKGVLFKCDPNSQFGSTDPWTSPDLAWYGSDSSAYYTRYDLKSETGWAALLELLDVLNNQAENLENILNIDRALWYLAVSTTIANYDAYNGLFIHNYYLYQHENGLFQMIPWDVSESFVGILIGNDQVGEEGLYEWDIFLENDPVGENRPLLDYVRNHPLYRKQYLAHIRTIIEEVLDIEALEEEIEYLQGSIESAALTDWNAFFGLGPLFFESNTFETTNFFGLEVAGILSTAIERKNYLLNHPEISLSPPQISEVQHLPENPVSGLPTFVNAFVENGDQVELMVTKNKYASHFQAIPMYDDGLHNDGLAGDGIFGAAVPYSNTGDHVKYYIRAQNPDAMMLHPQRAEYEFHEYIIEELVLVEEEEAPRAFLKVNPNPSRGMFTVEISLPESDPIILEVYDALGRRVSAKRLVPNHLPISLDLSELSPGIYFFKIGTLLTEKVLIIR